MIFQYLMTMIICLHPVIQFEANFSHGRLNVTEDGSCLQPPQFTYYKHKDQDDKRKKNQRILVSYSIPLVSYSIPLVSYSIPLVSYAIPLVSYSIPLVNFIFAVSCFIQLKIIEELTCYS